MKINIKNIFAFLNPYLSSCFLYLIIRGFMGMHLNAVGEMYFAVLVIAIFVSVISMFIYFAVTRTKKLHYAKDFVSYIVLTIVLSCLLIELFMFE